MPKRRISSDSEIDEPAHLEMFVPSKIKVENRDDDNESIFPLLEAQTLLENVATQDLEFEKTLAEESQYSDDSWSNNDDFDDDDFLEENGSSFDQAPNRRFAGRIFPGDDYLWAGVTPKEKFPEFEAVSQTSSPSFDQEKTISPLDYWKLFLNDDIVERIVKYTNKYGQDVDKNEWVDTTRTEIHGLIGLLYMLGLEAKTSLSPCDVFSSMPGLGSFNAPLTFSRDRYMKLLRFLRFDDSPERKKGSKTEKRILDSVSEMFSNFTQNCRKMYNPEEWVTVDESYLNAESMRRWPSKKCSYNTKILCTYDVQNLYLFDAFIDCKEDDEHTSDGGDLNKNVAKNLIQNLRNAGRTVVCSKFYISLPIADELYEEKTYILGPIHARSRGIPKEFRLTSQCPDKSPGFLFSGHRTLLQYQSKSSGDILLLSTRHHDLGLSSRGEPTMISDYYKCKDSFEAFDTMIKKYSTRQQKCRPAMEIFFWILDVAAWNAHKLYEKLNSGKQIPQNGEDKERKTTNVTDSRRLFLCTLANSLMEPQQEYRAQSGHWYAKNLRKISQLRDEICEYFKKAPKGDGEIPSTNQKSAAEENTVRRRRCVLCGHKRDRKSQRCCFQCQKPVCGEHSRFFCQDCCD